LSDVNADVPAVEAFLQQRRQEVDVLVVDSVSAADDKFPCPEGIVGEADARREVVLSVEREP